MGGGHSLDLMNIKAVAGNGLVFCLLHAESAAVCLPVLQSCYA